MHTELILLFLASYISATISGTAGFGGALILLPILTSVVGVKEAIPVLTVAQWFGNASRVWFGRYELKWKPIFLFLSTAIPLVIAGSYLFTDINGKIIKVGIGFFLILVVVYRRVKKEKIILGSKEIMLGGGITGFLSGIAGSAGPLGALFFLNLNPSAYIASEAFTALSLHSIKSIIYNHYALLEKKELYYGFFIGIAMILGSWTGKKIIEKINREKFTYLVEILLVIAGLQLMYSGL